MALTKIADVLLTLVCPCRLCCHDDCMDIGGFGPKAEKLGPEHPSNFSKEIKDHINENIRYYVNEARLKHGFKRTGYVDGYANPNLKCPEFPALPAHVQNTLKSVESNFHQAADGIENAYAGSGTLQERKQLADQAFNTFIEEAQKMGFRRGDDNLKEMISALSTVATDAQHKPGRSIV